MRYLEASRLVQNTNFKKFKSIKIFTSSELQQIEIHLRAEAAIKKIKLDITTNLFGTLNQSLIQDDRKSDFELLVLFPWDVFPELDWRTGGGDTLSWTKEVLDNKLQQFHRMVSIREVDFIVYCDAPYLPTTFNKEEEKLLNHSINMIRNQVFDITLASDVFSLKNYLKTGFPFEAKKLELIAKSILKPLLEPPKLSKKVIITDLDNTFWKGVLGEDGLDSIDASPKDSGYIHFIYQKLIKKLKNKGILIAVVSKNDIDLVEKAFDQRNFEFEKNDFVKIYASYDPKVAHIIELSEYLNLPLESFVFIDDSEVEITQVAKTLPEVTCLKFPGDEQDFITFLAEVSNCFEINEATLEDRNRTEMYNMRENFQKNISNIPPIDIDDFLHSLNMKIVCFNKSERDFTRALQLINKTNQFNMNGLRISDAEFHEIILSGGMLLTAEVSDNSGTHGEVIAMLIRADGEIVSLVMSCRVFDRKLEFVFLLSVLKYSTLNFRFQFQKTDRNDPFCRFYFAISDCLQNGILNRELYRNKFERFERLMECNHSFKNYGE